MKRVAVVILNYNGVYFLEKFLKTLIELTPEWAEIIVADNDSQDDSIQFLNTHFPEIKITRLGQNFGFAGGYNHALNPLPHEYFLLINSDVEVTPRWLEPLVTFLDQNSGYASVQPKVKDFTNKQFFEYAGACGGFLDTLNIPYCRGRLLETLEEDKGQYDSIIDIHWATGACFLIRSSVYRESGGFDTDFFAHMEEIDLCQRIRGSGWKIACVPASVVFHVGGGTLSKLSSFKTFLNFRNNLYLILKNEPVSRVLWLFPVRLVIDLAAGAVLWKTYSHKHFLAILKAYFSFLANLNKMRKKRMIVDGKNLPKKSKINLLWEYYLRRRRFFSDIPQ